MSFSKQVIAAIVGRRLSNGDFISIAAAHSRAKAGPVPRINASAITKTPAIMDTSSAPVRDAALNNTIAIMDQLLESACAAAAAGRVFDMGSLAVLHGLDDPALEAFQAGKLVVPYNDGTLFVGRFDMSVLEDGSQGETPLGIHITADETGAPQSFTVFFLRLDEEGLVYQPMSSFILHGNPERPALARVLPTIINPDGTLDEVQMRTFHRIAFNLGLSALLLANDDRLDFRRDEPAPALNKSRIKSGKPPLASVWRAPSAKDLGEYVTKITGKPVGPHASHGGTHASPVPHERRGHLRRLPSGKITRVRSSLVGGLDKHLIPARTRSFYEVKS